MIPVYKELVIVPIVFNGVQDNAGAFEPVTHINVPFDCFFIGAWIKAQTFAGDPLPEALPVRITDGADVTYSDDATIADFNSPVFLGHLELGEELPEDVRITAYTTDITLEVNSDYLSGDLAGYIILQPLEGTENDVWEGPPVITTPPLV